jgi:hypothetical protein
MLNKIVSGGQTGVDRGALDAALDAGFACGGWCPKGRKAEDGVIPARYPLSEMSGTSYRTRTRQNVVDSDATLVLFFGALSGGTLATLQMAQEVGKPVLTIDCAAKSLADAAVEVSAFVTLHDVSTLNVAGPRESTRAGAAEYARELISAVLQLQRRSSRGASPPSD